MTAGASPARDGSDAFDSIGVGGARSPGVVRLSGFKREQKIDVKEADGQKGATTTWKGVKTGKITCTFSLVWDPAQGVDDFADWDVFAEVLWSTVPPKSGAKPVAKDVSHPDLERNGYTSVILDAMGEMVHDDKGGATIVATLSEYFPASDAAAGSARGSKANKRDPNDPLTKASDELNALLEEGNHL